MSISVNERTLLFEETSSRFILRITTRSRIADCWNGVFPRSLLSLARTIPVLRLTACTDAIVRISCII
ncbi:hypothetical protein AVEN_22569-1 [Araneus ventricosus]|uniref:Uncharacterized protein n=1 Tax=Araneus ventricosus TaxID=182803 RepID=A0A4Y2E8Y2_ARAVE|nr:hypothetical protein AVEN_22569-1 [Araneus ventricosus]